jgi:rubrerythrin
MLSFNRSTAIDNGIERSPTKLHFLSYIKGYLLEVQAKNSGLNKPITLEESEDKLKIAIVDCDVDNHQEHENDCNEHLKHLHSWMIVNTPQIVLHVIVEEEIQIDEEMKSLGINRVPPNIIEIRGSSNLRGVVDGCHAEIEQFSTASSGERYRVEGYRLSSNQETRDVLLSGKSYWVCEKCDEGVQCIRIPCPKCKEEIYFVPLTMPEFEKFVNQQRRFRKDNPDDDAWYCHGCNEMVETSQTPCPKCDKKIGSRILEWNKAHRWW